MIEGLFTPMHLVLILVIAFAFFGAKRLPEMGKSLGSGIREFRKGVAELHTDIGNEQPASAAVEPRALTAQVSPVTAAGDAQTSNDPADVAGK